MSWLLIGALAFVGSLTLGTMREKGHLVGIRTHAWHLRQTGAKRVLDPVTAAHWKYPALNNFMCRSSWCTDAAAAPCGKCWAHCPRCTRSEAAKKQGEMAASELEKSIAALERDNGIGGTR